MDYFWLRQNIFEYFHPIDTIVLNFIYFVTNECRYFRCIFFPCSCISVSIQRFRRFELWVSQIEGEMAKIIENFIYQLIVWWTQSKTKNKLSRCCWSLTPSLKNLDGRHGSYISLLAKKDAIDGVQLIELPLGKIISLNMLYKYSIPKDFCDISLLISSHYLPLPFF